ncbi:hypothetical protein RSG19_003901 [Yersinia enterocolitica]|nr:hypothetical protein [Yersinia enterocolitica]ELI8444815.1 hypothetical protein [Yersinia enterocolitica]
MNHPVQSQLLFGLPQAAVEVRHEVSISAVVPRFVNEQPVVLTGAASSSCMPHRCFVSME